LFLNRAGIPFLFISYPIALRLPSGIIEITASQMSSHEPNNFASTATPPSTPTPLPTPAPKSKSKSKLVAVALTAFILLLAFPFLHLWFTAPPDPIFEGQRLSSILYDAFDPARFAAPNLAAQKSAALEKCRAALKHLGTDASPLLTDWLHNEPTQLRQEVGDLLKKNKINFPFFTAARAQIVRSIFWYPEAAVAVAPALQQHIVQSDSRRSTDLALNYARLFNSIDEPSRKLIASRSVPFIQAMLDRFERDREDIYPLALIGMILKADTDFLPPDQKTRILKLAQKSHYLSNAAQILK
jgi:hypothetical protein